MRYLKTYEKLISGNKPHVQVFYYKVIRTEPLENLKKYKNHRRLKVFYHKGVECANPLCDRVGTKLVHGIDKGGGIHIDLVTDDLFPFTIDHIYPKSKGGSNKLVNLDPMCVVCNKEKGDDDYIGEILPGMVRADWSKKPVKRKGNSIIDTLSIQSDNNSEREKYEPRDKISINIDRKVEVGDIVYKKNGKAKIVLLGEIVNIRPNLKHPSNAISAQIKEQGEDSLYLLSSLFKIIED
jgi:5-methylcytosine-specific restriction endonuclease McrA